MELYITKCRSYFFTTSLVEESRLNIEEFGLYSQEPASVAIMSTTEFYCGNSFMIANRGGIPASVIGFSGEIFIDDFDQPISFETLGNELYLARTVHAFPDGLAHIFISVLNPGRWQSVLPPFQEKDIFKFPIEIEEYSTQEIRFAVKFAYETAEEASFTLERIQEKSGSGNRDTIIHSTIQFQTTSSKNTEPVQFKCFEGPLLFPRDTP